LYFLVGDLIPIWRCYYR